MVKSKFVINNKIGLHARPAALFVQVCNKYMSEITVHKDNNTINGKSIIGVMALAAGRGETIEIHIDGPDEEAALAGISEFFDEKAALD